MARMNAVPDSRQHIGNWISHCHSCLPSSFVPLSFSSHWRLPLSTPQFQVSLLDLPTGFGHAGNLTLECHLPEAQAAHLKLAQISTRATTDAAPIPETDLKLGFLGQLGHHRGARHSLSSHVSSGFLAA
jgi:hypothetical protein